MAFLVLIALAILIGSGIGKQNPDVNNPDRFSRKDSVLTTRKDMDLVPVTVWLQPRLGYRTISGRRDKEQQRRVSRNDKGKPIARQLHALRRQLKKIWETLMASRKPRTKDGFNRASLEETSCMPPFRPISGHSSCLFFIRQSPPGTFDTATTTYPKTGKDNSRLSVRNTWKKYDNNWQFCVKNIRESEKKTVICVKRNV